MLRKYRKKNFILKTLLVTVENSKFLSNDILLDNCLLNSTNYKNNDDQWSYLYVESS